MKLNEIPSEKCKAVLSNKIFLPYSDDFASIVREKLTYKFEKSNPNYPAEIYRNYSFINKKLIALPISRVDLVPENFKIIDKRTLVPTHFPFPTKVDSLVHMLRDSQREAYDTIDDNWLITAKPGWGKTFTALAIITKLKQKALVLVHTAKLRDQWAEEVKYTLGFHPSIIGGGSKEFFKPITIATVQTARNMLPELQRAFGTVILDEVHRAPSVSFTSILTTLTARYKIGLSGTIRRKDKKEFIIYDNISRNIFNPPKENVETPKVLVVKPDIKLPGNHLMPWANRINALVSNESYKRLILSLSAAQAARGHKVLVVSDRVEFLKSLSDELPNSVCVVGDTANQKELEQQIKNGEKDILFGSISMYKEGISINELSCLILATPINNEPLLIQLIGRIIRKKEGKMTPEVVDIALKGSTGINQFRNRLTTYRKEGYEVLEIA